MRSAGRSLYVAAAFVAALALAAAACSPGGDDGAPSGGDTDAPPEPRLDIDPRSFYENYQPATDDGAARAVGGAAGAPAPAAPSPPAPGRALPAADDQAAFGGGESAAAESSTSGGGDRVVADAPPSEPPDVGLLDDNTFVDSGDHPFVATASDPRSTFSVDVDTGSYNIGRTFLTEGIRPEPASIRTEEWVNAFGYDYDQPDDGDVAVQVDGAPAPFAGDGTRLVRVGIQTRDVAREDRPPAALTLVVDTSGSMDLRERLGLVQSTLALLALELRDSDTVAVVTFDEAAEVILPPTPAEEAERIVSAIGRLTPSGGTNVEAGLREGYTQARAAFRPGAINTVVLASDGVANVGVTGTDPLSEMVRSEGAAGISLVTVGYGMGNYNDHLMEQLADRGDGFYAYVDTYEEAERLFTTELTSTLTVVAEEARAQVTFDADAVASYRLVGYENRDLADDSFRDDRVDTGEMGAGHAATALYEVRLADDGGDELGSVTVRYRPAGGDGFEEVTQDIALDGLAPTMDGAPESLRLAGAVAVFAELLAGNPVVAERGVTLDDVRDLVAALVSEGPGEAQAGGSPTPSDDQVVVDSGRPGVAELANLIDLACSVPEGDPEPLPAPVPTVPPGPPSR